jgi:hypothetical protein
MTDAVVISMGFNGYQWKWRAAIQSHEAYCRKHNYNYVFVRKPAFTPLLMECAWLKLPLIISALSAQREWVLYLDCDAVISDDCPRIESVEELNKSLYMVNGFSGRVNAGVMLIKNDPPILQLLKEILANALSPIPPEDDVGWGENGHVIHYVKTFPGLKILGTEWNNNQNPQLKDYIRHYSAGPMRQHYHFTKKEIALGKLGSIYTKIVTKLKIPTNLNQFHERLDNFAQDVADRYPVLTTANHRHRNPSYS